MAKQKIKWRKLKNKSYYLVGNLGALIWFDEIKKIHIMQCAYLDIGGVKLCRTAEISFVKANRILRDALICRVKKDIDCLVQFID